MWLVDIDKVRTKLSLSDNTGVIDTVKSAASTATVVLETVLQTSFDKGSVTDVFFINGVVSRAMNGYYTLKLSNGFVVTDSVVITIGGTVGELSDGSPVDNSSVIIKQDKGLVLVSSEYDGKYVGVTYDYGFDTDPQYIEDVPIWLQEVATAETVIQLSAQSIKDGDPTLAATFTQMKENRDSILNRHLRSCGWGILPL